MLVWHNNGININISSHTRLLPPDWLDLGPEPRPKAVPEAIAGFSLELELNLGSEEPEP